jgi:hypothetical protein
MAGARTEGPTRPAAFAGSWYPRDETALAASVDRYLTPAAVPFSDVLAVISPHAGLMYSGPVAGRGYATVREASGIVGGFEVAVLVGPSHFVPFEGVAVCDAGAFDTPFGPLAIDADAARRLMRADSLIHADPLVHAREHSLEMQLPFLARTMPGLSIVPLLMGRQTRATADRLAAALAASLHGRRALLVASSDLSHYHDRRTAAALDSVIVDLIERFDADGLQAELDRVPGHACGGGPMVTVMRAARALGASAAHVVQYADSGDVSGDLQQVVGYVSAVMGRERAA